MFLDRDTSILTSAQFCVLPLYDASVEFNPRIFNYQSEDQGMWLCRHHTTKTNGLLLDPAVLVVVATAQGTSAQVVSGEYPGQKLFFNVGGRAADLVATRLEDDRKVKKTFVFFSWRQKNEWFVEKARGKVDLTAKMDLDEQGKKNTMCFYLLAQSFCF